MKPQAGRASTDQSESTGRVGRPIDRSMNAQILAITLDALAQRPYDQVTLDQIASAAGRAKTTLYRRWPTKSALVLAAVHSIGHPPEADELPDEGTLRSDLIAVIDSPWLGGHQRRLEIFSGLAAAARSAPELLPTIRAQVTTPYITIYTKLLQRAIKRSLLPRETGPKIALLAEVIPAMTTQQLDLARGRLDREYYLALIDDILLPSLLAKPA